MFSLENLLPEDFQAVFIAGEEVRGRRESRDAAAWHQIEPTIRPSDSWKHNWPLKLVRDVRIGFFGHNPPR